MSEQQLNFGRYFRIGLGAAVGAALTLLTQSVYAVMAGPAVEWLTEKGEGNDLELHDLSEPGQLPTLSTDRERIELWDDITGGLGKTGEPLRVLISDLHIDTWEEKPQRPVDFIEFMETLYALCGVHKCVELYINGDLLDVPLHPAFQGKYEPDEMIFESKYEGVPHKGKPWPGVLPITLDTLLNKLHSELKDKHPNFRIFYITGNHDIGISGLRYFRPDALRSTSDPSIDGRNVLDIPAHAIWNPAGIIKCSEDKWVYVEHGHLHDPVLWLYMRYAIFDLLRGGQQHQERNLLGRIQRGGKAGQNALDTRLKSSQNTQDEHGETVMATGPAASSKAPNRLKEASVALVKLRYRRAARQTAKWLHKLYPDKSFTIVFGHTHIEDDMKFDVNGVNFRYINAGSWAGNQEHQTFWVIGENGKVSKPLQWPK